MFWSTQLSKHKFLEIEICRQHEWQWFECSIRLNRKIDHAGLQVELEVLGLWFDFIIYDHRHWDYDNDCWVKYEDTADRDKSSE